MLKTFNIREEFSNFSKHIFNCMGGPCEVITQTRHSEKAKEIFYIVQTEAKRIEKKYSRYEIDNIIYKINNARGAKVTIDKETLKLFKFADTLYHASQGLFDITSGILRKIWKFDCSSDLPNQNEVNRCLKKIGWTQVRIAGNSIQIPKGWELDLGGIGKEYAVDRAIELIRNYETPTLVNFGGDISVSGAKQNGEPWYIDIDNSSEKIKLFKGAVASSGDKNKYVILNGKKLTHILNPKTGRPIENAPSQVTVLAATCVEAGALATLALLQGRQAELFLRREAQSYRLN